MTTADAPLVQGLGEVQRYMLRHLRQTHDPLPADDRAALRGIGGGHLVWPANPTPDLPVWLRITLYRRAVTTDGRGGGLWAWRDPDGGYDITPVWDSRLVLAVDRYGAELTVGGLTMWLAGLIRTAGHPQLLGAEVSSVAAVQLPPASARTDWVQLVLHRGRCEKFGGEPRRPISTRTVHVPMPPDGMP